MPQWSLLSLRAGENQSAAENWTSPPEPLGNDYSSGSAAFVYDLTDFTEEISSFSLYDFDAAYSVEKPTPIFPASPKPETKDKEISQAEPRVLSLVVTNTLTASVTESHFYSLTSRLRTDGDSQDRWNPETAKVDRPFETQTRAETQNKVSNFTSSSGQKLEEGHVSQGATQQVETLTLQPTPSLLPPPPSPLLFTQPTSSLLMVPQSSSAIGAVETFDDEVQASNLLDTVEPVGAKSTDLHPSVQFALHTPSLSSPKPTKNVVSSHDTPQLSPSPTLLPLSAVTSFYVTVTSPFPTSLLISTTPPPPLWSTTVPLPSFVVPQQPTPSLTSSSQQAEVRRSGTDRVVESGHISGSGGVSRDFQPSLSLFLTLSSDLQRDFVDETASLLSLPLFSKAPAESHVPLVDALLLPEHHLPSSELSSHNISDLFQHQLLDAPSGDSVGIVLDSSFSQINPENSASSSVIRSSDLPQMPESLVLWSSSRAASQILSHSDDTDLSNTYPENHFDVSFTPLAAAGVRAFESTSAPLQADHAGSQHLHSAPLSNPSLPAPSPFSRHRDAETLTADSVVQVASVKSLLLPETSSSLSLTFNREQTTPHTNNQVNTDPRDSQEITGYEGVFNQPSFPLSSPSVMAAAQSPALSAPQPPSGLNYTNHSGSTQTNPEQSTSARTLAVIDSTSQAQREILDASEERDASQQPLFHLVSSAPPSLLPSLSHAATLFPSATPPSSRPLPSFITPSPSPLHLSWVTLPAVTASVSPAQPAAGSHPPPDGLLQASTTLSVGQLTESGPGFIPVSQSASGASPFSEVNDEEEVLSRLTNQSGMMETTSSNLTASGKQAHPSSVFDPAGVVPKIHVLDEDASSVGHESSPVELLVDVVSLPFKESVSSGAPVIPNLLHTSDPNTPFSTTTSRSSLDAPDQSVVSALEELPPPDSDNHTSNTAALKYVSKSTAVTLEGVETVDTSKAKNATTLRENQGLEASEGDVTGSRPAPDHGGASSAGMSDHHPLTTERSSPAFSSTSAVGGASVGTTPGPPTVLPCQCKQRFHFTCLCGLSSGNSMSCRTILI